LINLKNCVLKVLTFSKTATKKFGFSKLRFIKYQIMKQPIFVFVDTLLAYFFHFMLLFIKKRWLCKKWLLFIALTGKSWFFAEE